MPDQENPTATGIETEPQFASAVGAEQREGAAHAFSLESPHLRLTQVVLADATDNHNELVQERQWLLHPSEKQLSLRGNLFVVENLAEGSGRILIRQAPLPEARPVAQESDLCITPRKGSGFDFVMREAEGSTVESWEILEYRGSALERTRILHAWQRSRRPATPGHAAPRFLSNTWGDRSRDSRIRHDFIMEEIDAAQQLGVDVVQIDDGWQKGTTSNSAEAQQRGGIWEGFWNKDPGFWDVHPERFSQGLRTIVDQARSKGIEIGLWFAPDSWNDLSHWHRDASRILELFTTLGVEHFKIDGLNVRTERGADNLRRFFKTVREGSLGRVVFDLDITASVRPGYFGAMDAGPLFVENRYTDWHNYWPHQTLRNLWTLTRWVDPRRLRMEFLNNTRNAGQYTDDPLAPSCYDPATLFATVMFSNPLGWFEVSQLSRGYMESVAPLVQVWRSHREALFGGTIFPIGEAPDGFSYTGFLSLSETLDSGYVLVFRGLHPQERAFLRMPTMGIGDCRFALLASEGDLHLHGGMLGVHIPRPLGFVFARFDCIGRMTG